MGTFSFFLDLILLWKLFKDYDIFKYLRYWVNLEKLNLENNDLNDLEPKLFADFKKLNLLVFAKPSRSEYFRCHHI